MEKQSLLEEMETVLAQPESKMKMLGTLVSDAHKCHAKTSCIVPKSGGVEFTALDHDILWDKYFTAAPQQLRQYGSLSSVVRKAYKA